MSVGLGVGGVCYVDGPSALAAWSVQFPKIDGMAVTWQAAAPSISGSTVSYSLTVVNVAAGTQVNRSGTVDLLSCNTGALTLTDAFAVPVLADAASAWGAGFLTPMLVAFVVWGVQSVVSVVRGWR